MNMQLNTQMADYDMLPLLHHQHQYYNAELARTHQVLGKSYRKLAKIEKTLSEREERGLSRKEKKKLQWAKSVTKSTAQKLEVQQTSLHDYLRQCNDMIASYQTSVYHLPSTPWTAHLRPSPYPAFSPYTPAGPSPWTAMPSASGTCFSQQTTPQYWDLSMLRERRQSSPYGSSADSGFYEPAMYGHPYLEEDAVHDPDHVYAHELMSASIYGPMMNSSTPGTPGTRSKKSSLSEKDDLPELPSSPLMSSPARSGAEDTTAASSPASHRRRFSENAIQLIETRLAAPKAYKRGTSVGPVPAARRRVSHVSEVDAGPAGQ